ncbi:hypothetical protein [Streptomyces sp. NPDC090021]|uniref:hypothetical protein n=1 Tax=Streptomyces sp. NPDC090021 TaxID=3365919 RepID=UPI00380F549B
MQSTLAAVRPRLRSGVFFAPAPDGTGVVLTDGTELVTFHGASTYAWLERIAPHLNGKHTVAELTGRLTAEKRAMVERLVGALAEASLLRDVALDRPHTLSPAEVDAHRAEIAFIDSFRDSPELRFEWFRRSRTLVVGAGRTAVALAEAAVGAGVADLTVAVTGQCPTREEQLDEHRTATSAQDPGARISVHRLDAAGEPELRPLVEAAELVFYAADLLVPEQLDVLERLCAELGRRLVPAAVVADEAWIGPVGGRQGPTVGWAGLWRRVRPAGGVLAVSELLTGPVPGIIANHAVFRAFEHVTGVAEPDPDRAPDADTTVVRLDLEDLRTEVHHLPARPVAAVTRAETAEACAARVADLEAGPEFGPEALAERTAPLLDDRLGVFGRVEEHHYEQFPFRVVRLDVLDTGERIWGAGPDFAQARDEALRAGLARVAAQAAAAANSEETYGTSLIDGAVRVVPAARACSEGNDLLGIAAGYTWAAAVERALLDHCAHEAAARSGPTGRLDLADAPLTEAARHCADLLRIAGRRVEVTTLPPLGAVPVLSFRLDGDLIAHRAGVTTARALEDGLRQVLLAHQSRATGQPEYAPRSPQPPEAETELPLEEAETELPLEETDWDEPAADGHGRILLDALRSIGREPVVVPLDHDAALHTALPYLTRVVLLDV